MVNPWAIGGLTGYYQCRSPLHKQPEELNSIFALEDSTYEQSIPKLVLETMNIHSLGAMFAL